MKSLQDHSFISNLSSSLQTPSPHFPHCLPCLFSTPRPPSPPKTFTTCSLNPHQNLSTTPKPPSIFNSPPTHLLLPSLLSIPLPTLAAETDQVSDKINVEAIVVSIDDFFNRNPFFVAGVTFIWLVVIPLTQEYLKKCKIIAPIDAFRKLRDDPGSQLIDIRKKRSLAFMSSPSLKIFNKSVVQIEFGEGDEDGFVKEVMKKFQDPGNTVICVLDNFDGNSLKVAELLFKNGFKEAYAIKGGLRGKDGWQSIQEKLLPPAVHVYPRNKKSKSVLEPKQSSGNGKAPSSFSINQGDGMENGRMKSMETDLQTELAPEKPLSPFPKYPDEKPPSSPIANEP